jgi:hypothetical protein
MGIRRKAFAVDLLAEVFELLFGDATLEESPGVDAG